MKNHTFIYCGEDGNAGRALGNQIRDKDTDNKVRLLSCEFFSGPEPDAEHVIIMPDVPNHIGAVIRAAYPKNNVAPPDTKLVNIHVQAGIQADDFTAREAEQMTVTPAKRKPGRPRKVAA